MGGGGAVNRVRPFRELSCRILRTQASVCDALLTAAKRAIHADDVGQSLLALAPSLLDREQPETGRLTG